MTPFKLSIRRGAWQSLKQSQLPNYANNVVNQTIGKIAYEPIKDRLINLDNKSKVFSKVLDNVNTKGKLFKQQKDQGLQELYEALESVALGLENHAKDEFYILEAGMELKRSRTVHTGNLLPITKLSASSNGQKGQALVEFTCPVEQRSQVQTFAVEWSEDKATWNGGTYRNAERILVSDLPNRKDIYFRVRCLGTNGRVSEWSAVADTFVL